MQELKLILWCTPAIVYFTLRFIARAKHSDQVETWREDIDRRIKKLEGN